LLQAKASPILSVAGQPFARKRFVAVTGSLTETFPADPAVNRRRGGMSRKVKAVHLFRLQ
jgi:hypothetical protein